MSPRRLVPIALAAATAAMAVLVYLNALHNPFVYDDHRTILENLSIRGPGHLRAILLHDVFRPVVNISYAIDYAVWGLAPLGFHATSVLIHAANVVLLFLLMRKLVADTRAEPGASANAAAFATAAIWAVHPMMTQAVGYTSGRPETLCALFFLGALLAIHAWLANGRPALVVVAAGCWALALASKEVAVMLPFVLIAYEKLVPGGAGGRAGTTRRPMQLAWPMLALVAVAGAARLAIFLTVENAGRARFMWTYALVSLDVLRQYVSLMFLAGGQSIFHTERVVTTLADPGVVLNAVWIVALAALVWKVGRRLPLVGFGAAWLALMLVPSAVMLPLDVGEPMAEQRVYLAGAGFAIAAGGAFAYLREWSSRRPVWTRGVLAAALGLLLVALGARTIARNQIWSDPVRLWSEAVDSAPGVWLPYRGLGDALRDRQDYVGASEAYREAVRLRPQEVDTRLALGVALMLSDRLQEADATFAEAARLSPGLVQAETGRGMIARLSGRTDEARDRLLAVARAHPDAVVARQQLAEMYETAYADPASALRVCREIQEVAPATAGVADCISRNQRRLAGLGQGSKGR